MDTNKVKRFLQLNFKVTYVLREIEILLKKGISCFDVQLNMLSLGHMSPSTISPPDILSVLKSISSRLPNSVHLPADPSVNLWKYYKFLTCSAVLTSNKILILMHVPLLDSNSRLEIFYAHNLPIPMHNPKNDYSHMIANYRLESP